MVSGTRGAFNDIILRYSSKTRIEPCKWRPALHDVQPDQRSHSLPQLEKKTVLDGMFKVYLVKADSQNRITRKYPQ